MNQERQKTLTEFLNSDQERAKKLLALEASEALAQINSQGHDFSLDEINEYGKLLKEAKAKVQDGEELNLDLLDDVAGGGASITIDLGIIKGTFSW